MSNVEFSLNIPLDKDGYAEFECDFCKEIFLLLKEDFEDIDMPYLYCPVCGLPNGANSFLTSDCVEKYTQMIRQYALDEVYKTIFNTSKQFNRSSGITMKVNKPKKEHEKELFSATDIYVIEITECCSHHVKICYLDQQIGIYCPECGGKTK